MCRKHRGNLLTLCVVLIHLKYQKLVSGNEVPRDVDGGIVASPHKCETKPPPSASGFSFVHIIHTLNYHCVVQQSSTILLDVFCFVYKVLKYFSAYRMMVTVKF